MSTGTVGKKAYAVSPSEKAFSHDVKKITSSAVERESINLPVYKIYVCGRHGERFSNGEGEKMACARRHIIIRRLRPKGLTYFGNNNYNIIRIVINNHETYYRIYSRNTSRNLRRARFVAERLFNYRSYTRAGAIYSYVQSRNVRP